MKPRPAGAVPALAVGLLALVVLGVLAARHPELRFVDAIGFVARARRLAAGEGLLPGGIPGVPEGAPVLDGGDLVNGLYPIGYPLLLVGGHAILGDALLAAKVISVAAGGLLVTVIARSLGVAAGLFVLAQGALLAAGSTEGTDLAAASLTIAAALVAATRGPRHRGGCPPLAPSLVAGGLLGAALLTRYTAVAAVPVVLLLAPRRVAFLTALGLATAPHWGLALATGASVLPDQSQNLTIAAGHPTRLLSIETLTRWPGGFLRALGAAADPVVGLAGVGLLVGAIRRDRRAWGLLGVGLAHAALLAVAFANPRLALPTTLAFAAGAAFLLPGRWLALPAAALLGWGLLHPTEPDPQAIRVLPAVEAASTIPTECLATSPWLYQRRDGWLYAGVQIDGLGVPPPHLDPARLRQLAARTGARCVALDVARTRPAFPRLAPLLGTEGGEGYTLLDRSTGWRVWSVSPPVEPE